MSRLTEWSLAAIVLAPIFGLVAGLISSVMKVPVGQATAPIRTGMFISFLAAVALTSLLGTAGRSEQATVACHLGTWCVISETKTLPIVCEFRADFLTAVWLSMTTCLSWMTLLIHRRSKCGIQSVRFPMNSSLVSIATICFVLSGSFLQSLFFWGAISWTTLAMIVCSSPRAVSARPMRIIQTGLLTDIVLVLAITLIGQVGGSDSFAEICSADGLAALGARNPPLPGLIGCLLIVSAIGRCGLFPCFGWHRASAGFHSSVGIFIYAVGYVPSAVWLLLKCQPILLTSDVSMTLLGGMGTLCVVVGTFVACGQSGLHRLAYLISAQAGVVFVALASGLAEAVPWCVLHQCSLSLAAFVFFATSGGSPPCGRVRSWMIWCAALSTSAVFPFWGGSTQHGLLELNCHPAGWVLPNEDKDLIASPTDLVTKQNEFAVPTLHRGAAPHWGWLMGLWAAQGMTAFGSTMAAFELVRQQSDSQIKDRIVRSADEVAVAVVGGLLVVGGLCGWCLIPLAAMNDTFAVSVPAIRSLFPDRVGKSHAAGMLGSNELGRLAFSQFASIAGIIAAWRWHRRYDKRFSETGHWGSIVRLSHRAMYIDRVEEIAIGYPLNSLATGARFSLDFDLSLIIDWLIQLPAWLGRQVETLQFEWKNFELVVILVGTGSLLLAVVLII